MKTSLLIGAVACLTTSLLAADAKDEVKAAAKKLGDAGAYSWKATTEMGGGAGGGGGGAGAGGGRMRPGPTEGKIAKDGTMCLAMTRGETTTEAFVKGEKGAIKTQDGWQSLAEAAEASGGGGGGQGNRGRYMARTLQNYKAPAVEVSEMAEKAKELKKEGDMICGDLTEAGAKALMTFGRGGQGNAPEISDAKGSVKIWVKGGTVAKYEYKVSGKMSFNGNDRDIERTTTVEIKDVGTTKVEVPEEAKKKMS